MHQAPPSAQVTTPYAHLAAHCAASNSAQPTAKPKPPSAAEMSDDAAEQALAQLEVEWRRRMEAPVLALAEFETRVMGAIDRVQAGLPTVQDAPPR